MTSRSNLGIFRKIFYFLQAKTHAQILKRKIFLNEYLNYRNEFSSFILFTYDTCKVHPYGRKYPRACVHARPKLAFTTTLNDDDNNTILVVVGEARKTQEIKTFGDYSPGKQVATFYEFNHPSCLYNWKILLDDEIGGESQAEILHKDDYVIFKGHISDVNNELLMQRPYAALSSSFFTKINIEKYNGVRLTVKTDGQLYKLQMLINTMIFHDHAGFILDETKEWQTIEPSSHSPCFYEPGGLLTKRANLMISIETEDDTDFEIWLKKIELVNNPEFENLIEIYKRPFFFHVKDSYEKVDQLTVSKETLILEKEDPQKQKKGHLINDMFDNKQKSEKFVSFKDRFKKTKK